MNRKEIPNVVLDGSFTVLLINHIIKINNCKLYLQHGGRRVIYLFFFFYYSERIIGEMKKIKRDNVSF